MVEREPEDSQEAYISDIESGIDADGHSHTVFEISGSSDEAIYRVADEIVDIFGEPDCKGREKPMFPRQSQGSRFSFSDKS